MWICLQTRKNYWKLPIAWTIMKKRMIVDLLSINDKFLTSITSEYPMCPRTVDIYFIQDYLMQYLFCNRMYFLFVNISVSNWLLTNDKIKFWWRRCISGLFCSVHGVTYFAEVRRWLTDVTRSSNHTLWGYIFTFVKSWRTS